MLPDLEFPARSLTVAFKPAAQRASSPERFKSSGWSLHPGTSEDWSTTRKSTVPTPPIDRHHIGRAHLGARCGHETQRPVTARKLVAADYSLFRFAKPGS
jgi:hypothetical protein